MTSPTALQYCVLDCFLPDELVTSLEELVKGDPRAMELLELQSELRSGYNPAARKLWLRKGSLGPLAGDFEGAVVARFDEICAGTGIPLFVISHLETEVAAQQAGSFFAKHIDTNLGESRSATDRVISAVYYFPREPTSFTGGDLILYDFTGAPIAQIQPLRNRLVAFPSFVPHGVTEITAGGDNLDQARWSVNCWLHRHRPQ